MKTLPKKSAPILNYDVYNLFGMVPTSTTTFLCALVQGMENHP